MLVTLNSQTMPNHTNTWSYQTAKIMQNKIWIVPNHKRHKAKRWCIPQIPSCNTPSGQKYLLIEAAWQLLFLLCNHVFQLNSHFFFLFSSFADEAAWKCLWQSKLKSKTSGERGICISSGWVHCSCRRAPFFCCCFLTDMIWNRRQLWNTVQVCHTFLCFLKFDADPGLNYGQNTSSGFLSPVVFFHHQHNRSQWQGKHQSVFPPIGFENKKDGWEKTAWCVLAIRDPPPAKDNNKKPMFVSG